MSGEPLGYGYNPPGKVNPSPRYTSALLGRLLRYSNYHNYDNNWHIIIEQAALQQIIRYSNYHNYDNNWHIIIEQRLCNSQLS